MSEFSKTALYADWPNLPPLVQRAAACQALFADLPNVTVLHGDWRLIEPYGPFDLLVLDGGGGRKRAKDTPADPASLLKPGGTVILDDFYPALEHWPEEVGAIDDYGRSVTEARANWLQHPACSSPRSASIHKWGPSSAHARRRGSDRRRCDLAWARHRARGRDARTNLSGRR